jgi:transcriptional/translational regulatory protein YebC/TACO1
MLSQSEKELVELVLEVGSRALEQDTFEFMIEEGHPVEEFAVLYNGDNLDEVVESLEEKGLAYTESQREILRSTNFPDEGVEKVNWEHTEFETVDRRYIHFTKELKALYRE